MKIYVMEASFESKLFISEMSGSLRETDVESKSTTATPTIEINSVTIVDENIKIELDNEGFHENYSKRENFIPTSPNDVYEEDTAHLKPVDEDRTLFVGDLPTGVTASDLSLVFQVYGQ